jgi:Fe-S-cluster-containing hydrogenase component 2
VVAQLGGVRPASDFEATRNVSLPDDGPTQLDVVLPEMEGVTRIRPRPTPAAPVDWRLLRTTPFFDGLANEELQAAVDRAQLRVARLERDSLVPTAGDLALVVSGQLAVGAFNAEVLREERRPRGTDERSQKRERKRRLEVGPLAVRAERNLAVFEEGDVLETALGADGHATLAVYSATPATIILIARERAQIWRRVHQFMADRFRRASAAARARLDATDGARAAVADFFIRHGLSVSLTLRVRKLDACIECGACEEACEERHGAARLAIHKRGPRVLGGLDFVDACHTCTDQRCVDPCNFDAIRFDAARKEVLINEANCTGCTLCAAACPYDAIEMHTLDEKPLLKLRLDRAGALAFGDSAPRKAKLRRIAQKCDHCAFYADQACISACPTGALLEVLPSDVATQLPDEARAAAQAGYDRTAAISIAELNRPSAFVEGPAVPELGRARASRVELLMALWWSLGLVSVGLGALEIVLRKFWPAQSIAYWLLTNVDGLDAEVALGRVDFRPGCGLAVGYGYAGTAVMLSGLAYVWRRRLSILQNAGPLRAWFDWHVMTGVVGPAFILMHSAARLDNWVSLGFWSMVLTVLSGLMGRYLTTALPPSAAAVEILDAARRLDELRARKTGVRVVDGWLEVQRRRWANFERVHGAQPGALAGLRALSAMAVDRLAWRSRSLSRALAVSVDNRALRRQVSEVARRLARLERRRALAPMLTPLFSHWKTLHVPMAIAMTLISALHITLALRAR